MYKLFICEIFGFKRSVLYKFLVKNCFFNIFQFRIMDFPDFADVSFCANTNIGQLCEDLNSIVGHTVWYDTFQIKNSECL